MASAGDRISEMATKPRGRLVTDFRPSYCSNQEEWTDFRIGYRLVDTNER
jgi:hypothetical protein